MQPSVEFVDPTPWLPWWPYSAWSLSLWPVIILQLGCILHVVFTGRPYWWIGFLIVGPVVGALAYIVVEMRPWFERLDWRSSLWKLRGRKARMRICEAALAESPTVGHRISLAEELCSQGMLAQACDVLAAGLTGAFRDDPTLLLLLVDVHLKRGQISEAEQYLDRCREPFLHDQEKRVSLYRGRTLALQGRFSEAEPIFQSLVKTRRSEECRYYFAEALVRAGRMDQADEILADILRRYRGGTAVYRRLEHRWFVAARRLQTAARDGSQDSTANGTSKTNRNPMSGS